MNWFSGQAPVRKRAWTKGGGRKVGLLACLLACSSSWLFVGFSLLFVFLYSVCALLLWAFRVCWNMQASWFLPANGRGVSTENNVLDFRSGNTSVYQYKTPKVQVLQCPLPYITVLCERSVTIQFVQLNDLSFKSQINKVLYRYR